MKKWTYAALAVLVILALVLGAGFARSSEKAAKLEEEVASLTGSVQDQEAAIEKLAADADEKDAQILALTEETETQAAEMEKMAADTADKEAQLTAVSGEVGKKTEEIERLTADNTDKDARIETLTAENADKDARIETLTAENADKDARIEALTAENTDKASQIETLTAENTDKEEQIRTLSGQLETAGAEDLSTVEQGTFSNTKRFISILDELDMNYLFYPAGQETGNLEKVLIPNITSTSLSGTEYTYTAALFFAENNSEVTYKVWNLIDFSPENQEAVQNLCAALNYEWKWGRFYVDPTDNSVTVDYDCVAMDSPDMKGLMWDALVHLDDIISFSYDELAPYRK